MRFLYEVQAEFLYEANTSLVTLPNGGMSEQVYELVSKTNASDSVWEQSPLPLPTQVCKLESRKAKVKVNKVCLRHTQQFNYINLIIIFGILEDGFYCA